ncbi:hypothetical protein LshimejAT787_0500350 [Lyophyllum shimeji]|uniref:Uncharacterized protein n=1 Tax=Lyophyllum shimeji TaxID=47721 RepID=A0A9P3UNR5_LYOSH|nr:hypothetical protein LshimejAT787_0500350 [Lyophyllum shimeji]
MAGWNEKPSSTWRMSGQLAGNRRRHYWVLFVVLIVVLFLLTHSASVTKTTSQHPADSRLRYEEPPTLEKLKKWERELPQHNLDLPFPEGKTGRYVKFSNQVKRLGWNNALNELLMNTHLAYESKRAYVFQPFVWKEEHYTWPKSKYRNGEHLPQTPLNAIISGPTAGGPWDVGDDAPRSISAEWFDVVCPKHERRVINTREVKPVIGWADGIDIFNYWKQLLLDAPERCIEIEPEHYKKDFYPQTFDLWLWGSNRVLSLWPTFSKSPTSRLLEPSPIVLSAVERNAYLFVPRGPRPTQAVSRSPYDRMLAIHARRGDFKEACLHLAKWNSTFYSWNLLEELPDPFVPPPGGEQGNNTPENVEKYLEHCLPTFDDIVAKIRDSRHDYLKQSKKGHKTLDVLYLLTNAEGEWLDQLKATLKEDGWHTIVTSKDLELDQEQTEVNMAVDMEIARRAAVFIGNGWSSFTSNIVHKRLVDGKEPISCRFY